MDDKFDRPLPDSNHRRPPQQELARRAARGRRRITAKPLWEMVPGFMAGDAWLGMTPNSKEGVMTILAKHINTKPIKRRNGCIEVSYDEFGARGIRRQSVPAALKRAEELGFITVKRGHRVDGSGTVAANKFGLTFLPWHEAEDAANDWNSERCRELGRELSATEKESRRKNPAGEANVVLFNKRRKLGARK